MLCFEWWAFELLAIFSGYISIEAIAAEVIIINIVSFIFMIPLGISYAASALTGSYIGARKINLAKRLSNLTLIFNILITLVVLIIIVTFNKELATFFT